MSDSDPDVKLVSRYHCSKTIPYQSHILIISYTPTIYYKMADSIELQDLSTPPERHELPRSIEEDDVANSAVSIWSWVTASLYVLASNRSQGTRPLTSLYIDSYF